MILMKIFFIIIIAVCIVFYIMYLWDFALVLLAVVIAVPVIMFITALITRKNIEIEFASKSNTVSKRDNFPVQIKITNKSIFPVGKAVVNIEYFNSFNNEINNFTLLAPVQAKNTQGISFQLNSTYCGIVVIRCDNVEIYDPLRIFRFRTGKNISTSITVMPEYHEISGQICSTDRINEESSVFSEYKSGDDPSEIFDLRGYTAGDKLNRIHWKLSSKKDEFIVKDYSLPVDIPCTLFIDLNVDSNYQLAVFDTLMETLLSISQFLLNNERIHSIVYYNSLYKEFTEKNIVNGDDLSEIIKEIFLSFDDNRNCEPPQHYFINKNNFSLSSFVFITSDTEKSLFEYMGSNIDADIKNAVVVVTSAKEAERLDDEYADINITPVIVGRISSVRDMEL